MADKLLLTREEYIKVLADRGLPEVCAVYDEDTIATLEAQLTKLEKMGVYFRNSDKLSISDWQARRGIPNKTLSSHR